MLGAAAELLGKSPRPWAIFAPLSVSFTAMAAWQGGDGMLYACFLLGVLVAPFLVAPVPRRKLLKMVPSQ